MAAQQVIAAGGAEDRQLEAAHAALLRDNAIQFDLPPYVPPEPPSWLELQAGRQKPACDSATKRSTILSQAGAGSV